MSGQEPFSGRARAHPHPRRGMYLLPSLFTAGTMALGYYSITQTIAALTANAPTHLDWAAIVILIAIPFDMLDGRIARMTNTTSAFGKELDSLSDMIAFGAAPSLMAFAWGFHFLPPTINPHLRQHLLQAGIFICFLFLLSGASRLARFNISQGAAPRNPGLPGRKYFIGMPIPAAAGLLAATVHLCYGIPVLSWWISIPWLVLVGLCAFLMVSTWRFWSAKEINLSERHPFQLLVVIAIVAYIVIRYSNVMIFLAALAYMFSGIWARAVYSWSRRRRRRSIEATSEATSEAKSEARPEATPPAGAEPHAPEHSSSPS